MIGLYMVFVVSFFAYLTAVTLEAMKTPHQRLMEQRRRDLRALNRVRRDWVWKMNNCHVQVEREAAAEKVWEIDERLVREGVEMVEGGGW